MLKLTETTDITSAVPFMEPIGIGFKTRYQTDVHYFPNLTFLDLIEMYDTFQGLGTPCWMRD